MNWKRVSIVVRTELKQLAQAKDFWFPMVILGSLFFVVIPTILFLTITRIGDVQVVDKVSRAIDVLPQSTQDAIPTASAAGPITIDCLDQEDARRLVHELTEITAASEGDAT